MVAPGNQKFRFGNAGRGRAHSVLMGRTERDLMGRRGGLAQDEIGRNAEGRGLGGEGVDGVVEVGARGGDNQWDGGAAFKRRRRRKAALMNSEQGKGRRRSRRRHA